MGIGRKARAASVSGRRSKRSRKTKEADGEIGVVGVPEDAAGDPDIPECPFRGGGENSSTGVLGYEKYASGSTGSGGRRSFSISDFRASSNPVMASLMPSAPRAKVPYGNLPEPETFLSSDTFSDSSLI